MSQYDPPNRFPWPPVITLAALAAALLVQHFVPILWAAPGILRAAGWVVLAAGLSLDLWSIGVLRSRQANVLPHRAATRLVSRGPYAWSRNPIYVGNVMALTGAALAFANPWLLVSAALAAIAIHKLAVMREERHMAARFGPEWARYAVRTPRWVGLRMR